MKHVDHIINEREVLQYLTDKNEQYLRENPIDSINEETGQVIPECPFIMSIFSSFKDKENLYFELEYIQGCSLFS